MRFSSLKVTGQRKSTERRSGKVHRTNLFSNLYLGCSGNTSEAFDIRGSHKISAARYFALNIWPENASV